MTYTKGLRQIPPSSFLCYAQHSWAHVEQLLSGSIRAMCLPLCLLQISLFYCSALHRSLFLWAALARQTLSDGEARVYQQSARKSLATWNKETWKNTQFTS